MTYPLNFTLDDIPSLESRLVTVYGNEETEESLACIMRQILDMCGDIYANDFIVQGQVLMNCMFLKMYKGLGKGKEYEAFRSSTTIHFMKSLIDLAMHVRNDRTLNNTQIKDLVRNYYAGTYDNWRSEPEGYFNSHGFSFRLPDSL